MKPLLLALLCACLSLNAGAQTLSNCTPSQALKHAYANDVADLTFRRVYELHSPDTMQIEAPAAYQDTIWSALAAVCNLGSRLEADSVFLNYCVHQYRGFMPPSIVVKVDTSYAWTRSWGALHTTTGFGALDSFMQRHGVTVYSYFNISRYEDLNNRATLVPDHVINLRAFGDSLKKFPGVKWIEQGTRIGDGNSLGYTVDTAQHLTFFAGWGDCPAGCTAGKIWSYTIDPGSCAVRLDTARFVGFESRPEYLPNCNLRALSVPASAKAGATISIFPNPVQDRLSIRATQAVEQYQILDVAGRVVAGGRMPAAQQVAVDRLQPGVYFVRLWGKDAAGAVLRFLKQ